MLIYSARGRIELTCGGGQGWRQREDTRREGRGTGTEVRGTAPLRSLQAPLIPGTPFSEPPAPAEQSMREVRRPRGRPLGRGSGWPRALENLTWGTSPCCVFSRPAPHTSSFVAATERTSEPEGDLLQSIVGRQTLKRELCHWALAAVAAALCPGSLVQDSTTTPCPRRQHWGDTVGPDGGVLGQLLAGGEQLSRPWPGPGNGSPRTPAGLEAQREPHFPQRDGLRRSSPSEEEGHAQEARGICSGRETCLRVCFP